MVSILIDERRLEEIALQLSASTNLPHFEHYNRARRYNYIIPVKNPSFMICSLAFKTDNPYIKPNLEDLTAVPLTGDIYNIEGVETPVCSFIAYSIFVNTRRVSTHCEKVIMPVPYMSDGESAIILDINSEVLIKGLPLSVTKNVTHLLKYRR